MVCKWCGKETKATDGFCEHCEGYVGKTGTEAPKSVNVVSQQKTNNEKRLKICKSCFSQIEENKIYCPVCGKMADTFSLPTTGIVKKDGSSILGFFLGLFLGVLGLVIPLYLDQSETKSGAVCGFIISCIINGIVLFFSWMYIGNLLNNISGLLGYYF